MDTIAAHVATNDAGQTPGGGIGSAPKVGVAGSNPVGGAAVTCENVRRGTPCGVTGETGEVGGDGVYRLGHEHSNKSPVKARRRQDETVKVATVADGSE